MQSIYGKFIFYKVKHEDGLVGSGDSANEVIISQIEFKNISVISFNGEMSIGLRL